MAKQRVVYTLERDSPEIFKGENMGICSPDDFLIHMSPSGNSNDLTFLRCRGSENFKVFWYETEEGESITSHIDSEKALPQSTRIQDMVTSALTLSAQLYSSNAVLFQFWAPMQTITGETKLTLSEQPFGLGNLYKGLCRFKYHCMQKEYEDDHGQNGPPARVFKRGLCEDCPNLIHYDTKEFPTRDYAMECGIVSYWVLPLFESGPSQNCVGVLECFSMEKYDFFGHEYPLKRAAKQSGLVFPSSCFHECNKIRRDILCPRVEVEKALEAVREAHQLPLIHVWVPCMCGDPNHKSNSKTSNKLFCDMRICSENLKFLSKLKIPRSKYKTSFVKSWDGLVGSAYSENSPCFFRDMSWLSKSAIPFGRWTQSAGLTTCFVIPLKLVHPMLDDLFLEIFPPEGTCTSTNSEAVLKSLWSTLAQEFSKFNVAVGLKQAEEFLVEFSHLSRKDFLAEFSCLVRDPSFFSVKRITKVDAENTCSIESLPNDHNAQDTIGSSWEVTAEEPDHLNLPAAEEVDLDELKQCPNAHNKSDSSGEVIATMAEGHITLDVLKPYFGNIIDAAAEDLGVSRSTLKRKCRALGIKRWPSHKRSKDGHIQSNPRLKQSQTQKVKTKKKAPHSQFQTNNNAADREVAADSVPSTSNGDRICQSFDMIGKATYLEDTVMFRLKSNSGVEELRRELKKRFLLQAEKFKIKYKYREEWILIICDQDLQLGLEMIKSTEENTINLSISPLSNS